MRILTVRGTSMLPTLRPGDLLAVRPVRDPGRLVPGMLLLIRPAGERPVVHRLVRQATDRVVTWGDNRPALDPAVPSAAVRGYVVARRRGDGPWQRPRPWVAGVLARLAPPVPRWVAALGQALLAPVSFAPAPPGWTPGVPARPQPPAPRPDSAPLQVQRLGADWAVYDPASRDVHLLNPLAFAIWQRTAAGLDKHALLHELRVTYPDTPTRQLESDLDAALLELGQKGLLTPIHVP